MDQSPNGSRRPLIAAAAVVAVVVVVALVWFLGGDDPAEVDATAALEQADAAAGESGTPTDDGPTGSGPSAATTGPAVPGPTGSDGTGTEVVASTTTWSVDTEAVAYSFADGAGSFVGFRIDEELSNVGETEAVGRTPAVDGSLTIEGSTLTSAAFEGDARALTTDRSQRDRRARSALGDGILRFELTEPVDLGAVPSPGETVDVTATGDLLVNGTTQSYSVPLEASLSDSGLLVVTSSFDVLLADHEVEAPSAPIVLGVSDVATVEVQLFLTEDD